MSVLHDHTVPLPRLQLVRAMRVLDGQQRPVLCQMEAGLEVSLWVVKTPRMYGGHTLPLLHEVLAADVLSILGVRCPQVGLMVIPPPEEILGDTSAASRLVDAAKGHEGRLAFCSRFADFPTVAVPLIRPGSMSPVLVNDAVSLYCADRLLRHGDRQENNPNCLRDGQRLIALDHDRILASVCETTEDGAPIAVPDGDADRLLGRHIARGVAEREMDHPAWARFDGACLDVFQALDDLRTRIPDAFDVGEGNQPFWYRQRIFQYLAERLQRVVNLREGLSP